MTEAALAPFPSLEASDVEIRHGGPSYTIETLETLETLEVGARGGSPWCWERMPPQGCRRGIGPLNSLDRAHIAVVDRPGFPIPDLGAEWSVERVSVPAIDVSSRGMAHVHGGPSDRGTGAAGRANRDHHTWPLS